MNAVPSVLVDGREPTASTLLPFALVNDGHFTSMQVRARAVRGVELHLERLVTAHRTLFDTTLDGSAVRELLAHAVADHPDCSLRVTVTEVALGRPSVMTVVRPPVEPRTDGSSLLPVRWTRAFAPLKHVGTFPQIHLASLAEQQGYDDAVLVDPDGYVAETTIANLAFGGGGAITWPAAPALEGVTWQLLERALTARGTDTRRATVPVDDVASFSGAVAVNSIGVEPVTRIGTHVFTGSEQLAADLTALYEEVPTSRL